MTAPPPYNPQYPPNPEQGYSGAPPQQGYGGPPPQQGYGGPPPQQGYSGPPPQQEYPASTYPNQPAAQHQTIVVTQPAGASQVTTTYVHEDKPNHLLHCIITFFCPWWIFVWICLCCVKGC